MIMTIQQALRPLFLICFFIGLGIYPVKRPKPRVQRVIYLSILYSVIVWSLYVYLIYCVITLFTPKVFYTTVDSVIVTINILATITSSFLGFYYGKRFGRCMTKLEAVDNTLEQLGTPRICKKIGIWSKRIIIGWLLYVFTIDMYNMQIYLKHYNIFWSLILTGAIYHSNHTNILVDIIFIIFLWYIGNRFDKIHEHIKCLLIKNGSMMPIRKRSVISHESTNNYKQIFWTTMHLYLELHRIARELNMMFGTQVTLQLTTYLISLIWFWYHIVLMVVNGNSKHLSFYAWFIACLWAFSIKIRLYILNYTCDSVRYKANNVNNTFHQLTIYIRHGDMWEENYQFILQAIYRPLKFTGMGLFQFGQKFVWKLFITIASFVLIMMQIGVRVSYNQ